jgi:hypothetical protein
MKIIDEIMNEETEMWSDLFRPITENREKK